MYQLKKIMFGVILSILLAQASAVTTYASMDIQLKIDDVAVATDVKPELKNDRTMVPLRVISENLGATVAWSGSDSEVRITKDNMIVIVSTNSSTVEKNGEKSTLDVKPYLKNNRVFVPLRFVAEAFGSSVSYSNSVVAVHTAPLVIDGKQVEALQHEYRMTMGGVVQQIKGNMYVKGIYETIEDNKGNKVEAPEHYSWMYMIDTLGAYAQVGKYDFVNKKGDRLASYNMYTLVRTFPEDMLADYPNVLIYDGISDEWFLFSEKALESVDQLRNEAADNGYITVISNTVV